MDDDKVNALADVNVRNIDDVLAFAAPEDGLVTIELLKVPTDETKTKYVPKVVIYGKCAAGDGCPVIHAVIFHPNTFKRITAEHDLVIPDLT